MNPINEAHVSEPGLVVVDVAAADEEAALAFQQLFDDRWATSSAERTTHDVGQPGCWSNTERVLLTYEQVRAYELPATEGKRGDPRWPAFARRYGFDPRRPVQWEVEALEPAELGRLVLAAVDPNIDRDVLAEQIAREEQQCRALSDFLGGWGAAGGTSA